MELGIYQLGPESQFFGNIKKSKKTFKHNRSFVMLVKLMCEPQLQ